MFNIILAIIGLLTARLVCAQSTATSVQAQPTIVSGSESYAYFGCYNETTGFANAGNVRALSEQGNLTASDSMTVQGCLSFCSSMNKAFAGLEYSRECWCATSLNSNSAKLPDANCSLSCGGDPSQVCGGSLTLSVYQRPKSGTNAAGRVEIDWETTVAAAIGVAAAVALTT